MAEITVTIEERQKYIEDPDQRREEICRILQELTPEEIEEMKIFGDFNPDTYHGDDASDFFWELPDSFIYRHIDELIACGVEVEEVSSLIGSDNLHDTAAFLQNFDAIADHVGHGIDFDAFAKTYGVNPKTAGERVFVKLFNAAAEDFFSIGFFSKMPDPSHYGKGPETGRRFTKVLLANGASAKQLIAESDAGYTEILGSIMDLLLENDADANDIISRFDEIGWEGSEIRFLANNLDMLLKHGLELNRVQKLSNRATLWQVDSDTMADIITAFASHGIEY